MKEITLIVAVHTRHREAVAKHGKTTAPRLKENTNARDKGVSIRVAKYNYKVKEA